MATQEEIDAVRALVPDTPLSDDQIGTIIDDSDCVNQAIGKIWGQYAGTLAGLVNISEAGSSRSMGDLQKNALSMASYYAGLGCPGDATDPTVGVTRTRAIVRP